MPILREGAIAALWTPTDAAGRILEGELRANLDFLRHHGVHGLMVLGSTGEFVRLAPETRSRLLELVRQYADGLPAMANVSDLQPAVVTALGRRARELGYASVSLLPPWFFPQAQADLAEFFIRSAEAINLPLFLYNFPERTGNRLAVPTIAAVADRVPVAGVKQSGAEFDYHRELVALGREKGFVVLTGGESRLSEAMALGATGCVSGLANAAPELVLEIFSAVRCGDAARATAATARVRELGRLIDVLEFPMNVAAAMEARGLPVGEPKTVVSPTTQAIYARVVGEVRGLYHAWRLA